MKKNRTLLIITILFLTIGFAAVSTTLILNGTINIGTNESDFDVYFSNAILDGIEDLSLISEDKKVINFETKNLSKVGDKSILEYEVTNASTQYDANVSVTCAPNETDVYKVTNTIDKEIIEARSTGNGIITVELKKNVLEEQKINFTCTINSNALEREISNNTDIVYEDTYVLEGIYVDKMGKVIPNANLVIYSDTPHYVKTNTNGELLVGNLERGKHEVYQVNDTLANIKNMTKEEIKNKAITNSNFYTTSKEILFDNENRIDSTKISLVQDFCLTAVGRIWNYEFEGTSEKFTTLCDGTYKLEAWGASGGDATYSRTYLGGNGGYTGGIVELTQNNDLYVYVGGEGYSSVSNVSNCKLINNGLGYNGGAYGNCAPDNSASGGGGGATHISSTDSLLPNLSNNKDSIYIVAAGGGGGSSHKATPLWSGTGGYAGGLTGGDAVLASTSAYCFAYGATQTSPGTSVKYHTNGRSCESSNGSFGKGGGSNVISLTQAVTGGGGGFYGGAGAQHGPAAGGSSYIRKDFTEQKLIAGNASMPTHDGKSTMTGNKGNGYAKITLLSLN